MKTEDIDQGDFGATAAAARWAARLDAGPLGREEAAELQRWIDADPANEGRLDEFQRLHAGAAAALRELVAAGRLAAPRPERKLRRAVWLGTGVAVAGLAVAALFLAARPVALATGAAQRQSTLLADGTRVELNAHTGLAVELRPDARRVRLAKGEAHFTVARDPARPFIVEAPGGTVRVTGTVFNVRILPDAGLAVTVTEGSVEVAPPGGASVPLTPGDEATLGGGRLERRRLGPAALADELAWREGRIVFTDAALAEALARVGRFHGRTIEAGPGVGGLRIGGRFPLDDLEGFLRDLEVALPVRVVRGPGGPVRIERR